MIVYKATSKTTGKSYIGITSKAMSIRWNNHLCRAKRNWPGKLYNAIRKHGAEDFEVSAVALAKTWKELLGLEVVLIRQFDTFNNGYNMTLGGEGNLGWVPSPEWRLKLRKINLGKVLSDATRSKISASTAGANNPRFGTKWSEETRVKVVDWMTKHSPARGVPKSLSTRCKMSASARRYRNDHGVKYLHAGRSMLLKDWSRISGINRHTLSQRIKNGWELGRAISTPIDVRRSTNHLNHAQP
jgi:group I intron endonuclease